MVKSLVPLAVNEWLKNARACTYIRVMGAGNCKQRNATTGKVTNAGYIVGNQIIQDNGDFGSNAYANETDAASIKGRTSFLGCLMSESNGSTIFSSAGIQRGTESAGVATFGGHTDMLNNDGTTLILTNTDGTSVTFTTDNGLDETASTAVLIGTAYTSTTTVKATESFHVAFAAAILAGTLKMTLTPAAFSTETTITLTQDVLGITGNKVITAPANMYVNGDLIPGGGGDRSFHRWFGRTQSRGANPSRYLDGTIRCNFVTFRKFNCARECS